MAKDEDPIDQMISDLTRLLEQVKENKLGSAEGKVPEGVNEYLDMLESQVQMFREVTDAALQEMGIDQMELQETIRKKPETLTTRTRQTLDRCSHLRAEARQIQYEIALLQQATASRASGGVKKAMDPEMRKRKAKFRKTGGSNKWKPI